nr:protein amalgam-like [Biomphalaria glabrata]
MFFFNLSMKMGILKILLCLSLLLCVNCDDPKVNIIETDPPLDPISKTIISNQDKDVQLSCVVENKPLDVDVQWEYQTKNSNATLVPISTGTRSYDAFRWAIDNPSPTTWRLRIQNVQLTDEGIYRCKVQVQSQNYVKMERELRVVMKPQISDLDTSNDMTKNADDPAKLECFATGIPKPLIKWTRMAGELLPNGGKEFQGNVLTIDRIQSSHGGVYNCFAENSAGTDFRQIRITVNFRPEVYTGSPIVKQAVGYNKALVCNIKGYPAPAPEQIAWSKEGRPVFSTSRTEIRNIPGASNRITSILVIRDIQQSDFGRYQCSAENEKGSRYVTMELQSSPVPTADRTGSIRNGVTFLSFNLATVFMLVTVILLHNVQLNR